MGPPLVCTHLEWFKGATHLSRRNPDIQGSYYGAQDTQRRSPRGM